MSTIKVNVSKVNYPVTSDVIRQVFAPVAPVTNARVLPPNPDGSVTAYLSFPSPQQAQQAMQERNDRCIYQDCNQMSISIDHSGGGQSALLPAPQQTGMMPAPQTMVPQQPQTMMMPQMPGMMMPMMGGMAPAPMMPQMGMMPGAPQMGGGRGQYGGRGNFDGRGRGRGNFQQNDGYNQYGGGGGYPNNYQQGGGDFRGAGRGRGNFDGRGGRGGMYPQQQQQGGFVDNRTQYVSLNNVPEEVPLQRLYDLLECFGGVEWIKRNAAPKRQIVTVKMSSVNDAHTIARVVYRVPLYGPPNVQGKLFPGFIERSNIEANGDPMDSSVSEYNFLNAKHRAPHERTAKAVGVTDTITVHNISHRTDLEIYQFLQERDCNPTKIDRENDASVVLFNSKDDAVKAVLECNGQVCGEPNSVLKFAPSKSTPEAVAGAGEGGDGAQNDGNGHVEAE